MSSNTGLKHGVPIKQAKALDNALSEIIKKRMQRNSNNPFVAATTGNDNNSNLKILEQEYSDSVSGNLYVGNLHPRVSEEILFREFCKFGPIENIKIMYPRTAEDKAKGHNCGFVKFFEKEDAELAMNEISDAVIFGNPIRVGWGKAIPKNPNSLPEYNALTINHVCPGILDTVHGLMMNPSLAKIHIVKPEDENIQNMIDLVSRLVSVVSNR